MADTKSIAAIQVGVDQTLTYPGKSILQKWEVFCQVLSSCVVCTPSQRWSQFATVQRSDAASSPIPASAFIFSSRVAAAVIVSAIARRLSRFPPDPKPRLSVATHFPSGLW